MKNKVKHFLGIVTLLVVLSFCGCSKNDQEKRFEQFLNTFLDNNLLSEDSVIAKGYANVTKPVGWFVFRQDMDSRLGIVVQKDAENIWSIDFLLGDEFSYEDIVSSDTYEETTSEFVIRLVTDDKHIKELTVSVEEDGGFDVFDTSTKELMYSTIQEWCP